MKVNIQDNHIGIFKETLPENLIDNYLDFYKRNERQGGVYPRSEPSHKIEDNQLDLIGNLNMPIPYNSKDFLDLFFKNIYPHYCKKYSLLNNMQRHGIYGIKIQKTSPGQGYHAWHCESAHMASRNRIMAFMIYLNDVKEGGETEFLYQKCRFKPKRNTLLIWPATYTHVHRGNPPLSNDKYILTGWVEYGF